VLAGGGLAVLVGGASVAFGLQFGSSGDAGEPNGAAATGQHPPTSSGLPTVASSGSGAASSPSTGPSGSKAPSDAARGAGSDGGGVRGSGSCPLPAYPDASCTGIPAGTQLTAYKGPTNITTANTVIDAKIITSCITINAPGVVIKRSRVNATGCSPIYVNAASKYHGGFTGAGATVQDSTISCLTGLSGSATNGSAIGDNNVTVLRNNIFGCENGFDMDMNADIEDNYIHDLYQSAAAHTDGLQSADGSGLKLVHNTFYGDTALCPNPDYCAGTSAVNINNCRDAGCPTTTNTLVRDNLLAGGAYTLYCPIKPTSNFQVLNNRFSFKFRDPKSPHTYRAGVAPPWKPDTGPGVGAFGPSSDCQDGAVWSGNVFKETGQPIPF
jgi:hypothetical protein